eukprot:930881_1
MVRSLLQWVVLLSGIYASEKTEENTDPIIPSSEFKLSSGNPAILVLADVETTESTGVETTESTGVETTESTGVEPPKSTDVLAYDLGDKKESDKLSIISKDLFWGVTGTLTSSTETPGRRFILPMAYRLLGEDDKKGGNVFHVGGWPDGEFP